jgi:hypothetical protein
MVDLGKFSIKELSNEGVEFYLKDEFGVLVEAGEDIPIKFILFGGDSSVVTKAKQEYSQVQELKNVKAYKVEQAALTLVSKCIKSWDQDFKVDEIEVVKGDFKALIEFFKECPMFRDQIITFVFEREHFLAS